MFVRLLSLLMAVSVLQGCISIPLAPSKDRGRVALEMVQTPKQYFTTSQVLLLPLSGLVSTGSEGTGLDGDAGMLVELKDRLDAARKNKRICAVVLRIDTPGGTVSASDLIHREIMQFKQETGLPVIAQMGDVAASGGFYIAMAADEVYAMPTTVTGSIGVLSMFPNFTGISEKIGVTMNIIKAGKMKDAGSPWRAMKPEEQKLFQDLVDQFYMRFTQVILESRRAKGLTSEELLKVADGRVLTPEQAQAAHLIDGIKYPDEVIARAIELGHARDAAVVSYEYPYHYRGNLYASSSAPQPRASASTAPSFNLNLFSMGDRTVLSNLAGAHFMYLWLP